MKLSFTCFFFEFCFLLWEHFHWFLAIIRLIMSQTNLFALYTRHSLKSSTLMTIQLPLISPIFVWVVITTTHFIRHGGASHNALPMLSRWLIQPDTRPLYRSGGTQRSAPRAWFILQSWQTSYLARIRGSLPCNVLLVVFYCHFTIRVIVYHCRSTNSNKQETRAAMLSRNQKAVLSVGGLAGFFLLVGGLLGLFYAPKFINDQVIQVNTRSSLSLSPGTSESRDFHLSKKPIGRSMANLEGLTHYFNICLIQRDVIGYDTLSNGTRVLNDMTKKWIHPPYEMILHIWMYSVSVSLFFAL